MAAIQDATKSLVSSFYELGDTGIIFSSDTFIGAKQNDSLGNLLTSQKKKSDSAGDNKGKNRKKADAAVTPSASISKMAKVFFP